MLMLICSVYMTGNSIALHVQSTHSLQTVCWLDHCQFVAFTFSQCSPQYVCSNTSAEHFSMTHKDVSVLICSNLNSIKTIPQCFSVILQWSRTYGELDKQVYSMDVALQRSMICLCREGLIHEPRRFNAFDWIWWMEDRGWRAMCSYS